jgi:hypothetical protein
LPVVGPESGDNRLLEARQLSAIDVNYPRLVELLDPDSGFVDALWAAGCINLQHRKHIETGRSDIERNRLMLDIMRRRSLADFNKFIGCLVSNKQEHLAALLLGGGGKYRRYYKH